MIAWNYVLGRENIPHIIKLRVSCYARPLRHNNCSVPFISNSDWVNVCHSNNHTSIFQACSGCHLCHIYFSYYWIPGHARVYWTRVLQVSGLQYVCLDFFRGMDRVILRWNCFQNTSVSIYLPSLFLYSSSLWECIKSLDLSRMIPVAVEVLYFFFNSHSIIQHNVMTSYTWV